MRIHLELVFSDQTRQVYEAQEVVRVHVQPEEEREVGHSPGYLIPASSTTSEPPLVRGVTVPDLQ